MALCLTVALADVELVLKNGDTLQGTDVRRDGDNYVLTTKEGGAITLPLPTVEAVRLLEPEQRNLDPDEEQPRTGLQTGGPKQIEGEPVRPPTPAEQTAAIGRPSKFIEVTRPDPIEATYWDISHNVLDDSRSTWVEPINDPEWTPKSSLGEDQLAKHKSTWVQPPNDPTWVPTSSWN